MNERRNPSLNARHPQRPRLLEPSADLYRELVETTYEAIAITRNGLIVEANPGFLEMFGYTAEEVIGEPMLKFVAPESVDGVREQMTRGEDGCFEFGGCDKNGRKLVLEAMSKSRTIEGSPTLLTAIRNLTEKRALEENFRQAQKMGAIARLAGGVAHDFNNLLTTIDASAHFLLEDLPLDSPLREDTLEIRRATDRAATLTRQLLAFSHKQVVEHRVIDLNEVVTLSEKMLGRILGEEVEFVRKLNGLPVRVEGDETQLQQILMNLSVNARDALPKGGVITIETSISLHDQAFAAWYPGAAPGWYAILAVSDNGIGMDEETLAHVFEPFFTTKGVGKGTGFGLASVYGIVNRSGGFISVTSRVGAGSRFEIHLPLFEGDLATGDLASPSLDQLPHGSESVLLAEDEPSVRSAVRQMLERLGYKVIVAPNGSAALNFARKHPGPIDLLLTDVVMPEMSGSELAEKISTIRPDAKILFMSGYADDAVVRYGVFTSRFAYLQKPFAPDVLALKIREVLEGRE